MKHNITLRDFIFFIYIKVYLIIIFRSTWIFSVEINFEEWIYIKIILLLKKMVYVKIILRVFVL